MAETVQREAGLERLTQYDAFPVPLKRIYYDADFNCRDAFTLQSVSDLAESIRLRGGGVELKGLDYPIVVQPIADMVGKKPAGCDYRLIAGHRRYKAMEVFLKWTRAPAMILAGLSEHEARMLNFVENLEAQRPESFGGGSGTGPPLPGGREPASGRRGIEAADRMGP